MQKQLLDFLQTDLQFVKGVGPVMAARLNDVLGGRRILDFLLHKPFAVRPREVTDSITNAVAGELITIPVQIKSYKPGGKFRNGGKRPAQFVAVDKYGATVTIQFFGDSYLDYWQEKLPIGSSRAVSGKLEYNNYTGATINHPDFVETVEQSDRIPKIQAIYPSGEGLTQKTFANIRDQVFNVLSNQSEMWKEFSSCSTPALAAGVGRVCDRGVGSLESFTSSNPPPGVHTGTADPRRKGGGEEMAEFLCALYKIHHPETAEDIAPTSDAMMKLAYAELFAHQVAIVLARKQRQESVQRNQESVKRNQKYNLLEKFYAVLPFKLTGAQDRVIDEIFTDMSAAQPMVRMVQGDVGSGKTMVALAAAVKMAESGGQSVLMAPTDTLSQQHFAKLKPMCDKIGIVCDILTGRDKGAARREKLTSLKSGRTKLCIGTHALFSEDVEYKDLGLVIVDEQHRFGVSQREAMRQKGKDVDLLSLSATPIPRTLSMTIYGDMDVSIINEKPAGRLPIKTSKINALRAEELVARLRPQIDAGAKVFWVCPLVAESETSDLMAAEQRYEFLHKMIAPPVRGGSAGTAVGGAIGLVHGQMDKKKRDAIMDEFSDPASAMKILVSTTVIEVGIDVPSATIMVIENAERFGLAALHQLRGRVGRGDAQSFCILMFGNDITENGMKRLSVLCETDDGFVIAEQDLMMRGTGELLGTKQSGWINYHFVDYREHRDLFKLASRDARDMTAIDEKIKDLLFIFDREVTVKA